MKKIVSIILAAAMVIAMTACGGNKSKKAFEASKEAYNNVNAAYEITEKYGSDIYEAWRLGIYKDDEVMEQGCSYLATELYLTEDEIAGGVAYTVAYILGKDWDSLSEDEKDTLLVGADGTFKTMEDDLFSWCVMVVSNAYIVNGKVDEAQGYLTTAKEEMKNLSENYSDYEHYPALKGYYTTTSSFFDFCQNPTGSFEQLKTTIENYKTTARDYNADLNYIFED
jgi:hypothetical protein